MDRVSQHTALTADLGHRLAQVQSGLYLRQHLRREFATGSRFGRHKERGGPAGPILVRRARHGHFGHPKSAANVPLGGAAIDHPLAGKEPEGRPIGLGVGEDGQMAVEVSHLAVVTLERQIVVQMRSTGWKQGNCTCAIGWIYR